MKQAQSVSGYSGSSASAYRLLERLMATPHEIASPEQLLTELAHAFAASGAGFAAGPSWHPLWHVANKGQTATPEGTPWPWQSPEVQTKLRNCHTACSFSMTEQCTVLAACGSPEQGDDWVIWVERDEPRPWNNDAAVALGMVAACIARAASVEPNAPSWALQLGTLRRRHQLDETAQLVRKLAHDFGNVLTSVLGFAELGAALVPATSPVQRYLSELQKAARTGADWTDQLRQFARAEAMTSGMARIADTVRDPYCLPQVNATDLSFTWDLPMDLPAVAIDARALGSIIRALLLNAAEASGPRGTINTRARVRELAPAECLEYLGRVRPGRVVEVVVHDQGEGLREAVRRRLFREPFFTTRSRKRGMGLAIAYGTLAAHQGGIRIESPEHAGTSVRFVLPASTEGDIRGLCNR
jgi:signal transduction histidine kinase